MAKSRNDRNGTARRKLRARVKAMGLPCAICGGVIDYALPAGDPMSYELDEIIPFSLGGSELDANNVQPTHRICNERKHNKLYYHISPQDAEGYKQNANMQVKPSIDWSF